jgi:type IV pilus assembly protein PilA
MGTTWRDAFRRVATALARRRAIADGEDPDLSDQAGFTLIELMVVLVIMGILMAIAIPTFLGVTSTANDTSTQSNLSNIITAAKAVFARTDSYPKTATMVAALTKDEPEFSYTTATSAKQDTIGIKTATTTGTAFVAVAYMTKTDECWVATNTAKTGRVHFGYIKPSTGTTVAATACKAATVKAGATTTIVTWGTGNKWPAAPTGH